MVGHFNRRHGDYAFRVAWTTSTSAPISDELSLDSSTIRCTGICGGWMRLAVVEEDAVRVVPVSDS